MATTTSDNLNPLMNLNRAFLLNHPDPAARTLERLPPEEAALLLENQDAHIVAEVLARITPGIVDKVFLGLSNEFSAAVISDMDPGIAVTLLARLDKAQLTTVLENLSPVTAMEFKSLLEYPENSVGRQMTSHVTAFNKDTTVAHAIGQLKTLKLDKLQHLFLLGDDMKLAGEVDIQTLVLADHQSRLETLGKPVSCYLNAMDPRDELTALLDVRQIDAVPVVDLDFRLVGVVKTQGLMDAVREDIMADMATMVGASKDERALSSTFFAVRKRLPWLQINLLTAFLAAAVVGLFEDTIAQFTALAILLPIAAGQSGNAGAQALAVTMRGLTLREITMKHWFKVMTKEFGAGFLNGCGIAVTCSIGVYVWSQSLGLALVMALAMIISMTLAGAAGALVPIGLKRFGMDPAQSSSIVLTTVTDIAGFMSFLGIATLLSGMLVAG